MGRSRETGIGRAGEYLVAHLLELEGIETYRVDGDFDLVINVSGALMRLEVKASSGKFKPRGSYRFFLGHKNADAYVFVALDLGRIRVKLAGELGRAKLVSVAASSFTPEAQSADIQKLLGKVLERPYP